MPVFDVRDIAISVDREECVVTLVERRERDGGAVAGVGLVRRIALPFPDDLDRTTLGMLVARAVDQAASAR